MARCFRFCATWLIAVASVLVPVYWTSQGLLLLNLSSAKFGPLAFTYIHDVLARLLLTEGSGFTILLIAFGAHTILECCKDANKRIRLIIIYALVSCGLAIVGSAAAGAHVNHYLEPALALALVAPIGLSRLASSWRGDSSLASFATILVVLLLLPSLDAQVKKVRHAKRSELRNVLPLVMNRSVFTDIPYLSARAASPQLVDLASLINTQRVGGWAGWSSARVVEVLQKKDYEVVILSQPVEMIYVSAGLYPRWPRMDLLMRRAIGDNYRFCFQLNDVYADGPLYVYGPLYD